METGIIVTLNQLTLPGSIGLAAFALAFAYLAREWAPAILRKFLD